MPQAKPGKYMVCVDAGDESRTALRLASLRALARGSRIELLHVMPPADFQTLPGVAERIQEEQRAEAEALMASLAEVAEAIVGAPPLISLRQGSVGDEIIAAAMENATATVLVLGVPQVHAGRGRLVSWLAGQLGGKLLIPLLLVPGNLSPEQLEALV